MLIHGRPYYIMPEGVVRLFSDKSAEVVNEVGEQEGTAWLSPVLGRRKRDLTVLIQDRLFVVTVRDMQGLIAGGREKVPVREYAGHSGHSSNA
jgi:hypothetical protein